MIRPVRSAEKWPLSNVLVGCCHRLVVRVQLHASFAPQSVTQGLCRLGGEPIVEAQVVHCVCAWLREGADIARPMAIPPVDCASNKALHRHFISTMMRRQERDGIADASPHLGRFEVFSHPSIFDAKLR